MFGSSGAKAAALRSSRSASPVRPKLQREVIYGGIGACECLRTRSRINGGLPLQLHILITLPSQRYSVLYAHAPPLAATRGTWCQ